MSGGASQRKDSKNSNSFCFLALVSAVVACLWFVNWYNASTDKESVSLLTFTFVFFIGIKSVVRWCVMNFSYLNLDIRNKFMFLMEHVVYSVWAYYEIVLVPEKNGPYSWLLQPPLCWTYPKIPSESFHLFFIIKTATHVEDLLYIGAVFVSEISKGGNRDIMMDVHHIVTAALCISSYVSGYVKIGSLVMLIHDVSDVPLDLLRISVSLNWKVAQVVYFVSTLLTWAYWRLYLLPSVVLYTIAFDGRSFLVHCSGTLPECFYVYLPERIIFIGAIGTLLVLHYIWFYKMLLKGYRELVLGEKKSSKKGPAKTGDSAHQ